MSCGKPHETPCSDVLAKVYAYLDGEIDQAGYGDIKQHLDECGPCLQEYGLEQIVKELVHKHCGHDTVPDDLRDKVLGRIASVRAHLQVGESDTVTE